jgi:site-specific recombinase XerD
VLRDDTTVQVAARYQKRVINRSQRLPELLRRSYAPKTSECDNAHMLRHACDYALANAGHDTRALQAYLGHRNIQNTTRYTALAQDRFARFWRD